MESILLVVHVLIALLIVGLIMLQQGKGAEMGASFGSGSSQTVFGASGSGNFFSRMTGILVAVFFASSMTLAIMAKNKVDIGEPDIPVAETVKEQVEPVSEIDSEEDASDDSIPELPSDHAELETEVLDAAATSAEEATSEDTPLEVGEPANE